MVLPPISICSQPVVELKIEHHDWAESMTALEQDECVPEEVYTGVGNSIVSTDPCTEEFVPAGHC